MRPNSLSRLSSVPLLRYALVLGALIGMLGGATLVGGLMSRRQANARDLRPSDETINIGLVGGAAVVTGTGASGSGVMRVTVSSDSSLAAHQSTNVDEIGGSALALGQAAMTASMPVVIASNQTAVPVSMSAAASTGGTSMAQRNLGALTLIKGSAGTVFSYGGVNTQSSLSAYVQCFDAATTGAVTLGTTHPTIEFELYAGGQLAEQSISPGKNFASGIVCASTTTEGGATPSASGVQFFGSYL